MHVSVQMCYPYGYDFYRMMVSENVCWSVSEHVLTCMCHAVVTCCMLAVAATQTGWTVSVSACVCV